MTNFEVIIKEHPQFVKAVLSHCVSEIILEKVVAGDHEQYIYYSADADKNSRSFLNANYVQPVLDNIEKKYLSDVIRPFRSRIEYISKIVDWAHRCFIVIYLKTNGRQEQICLPHFSENSNMYKGMAFEKLYTLKDLGL